MLVAINILRFLSDSTTYPCIPKTLIDYTRNCLAAGVTSRYIDILVSDTELTVGAINRMFEEASRITGLSPDELLRATDFHPNDLDPHRVEAAFAEVRTISFLDSEGFTDIQPLPASGAREADFLARNNRRLFAIEVADSVFDAANRNSPDELVQWAFERAMGDNKIQQIEQTMNSRGCSRGAFIFAVDTQGPTVWLTRLDFESVVMDVWRELGPRCDIHVGAFTGRVTLRNIPDDVMFPEGSRSLISCLWLRLKLFLGLGI